MAPRRLALALALVLSLTLTPAAIGIEPDVLSVLTTYLRFTPSELADLDRGAIVKHNVDARASGEVAVAGAVRIAASKAAFMDAVRDIVRFKRAPGVLQIGRFSTPPVLSDLDGLTVTRDDFDVRTCRVGSCGIRLPADVIQRFAREINPKAPDVQARTAALFKQVLLDHVNAYLTGGPGRITSYDDERQSIKPMDEFEGVLKNAPSLGALVPGLPDHFLRFPENRLPGAEDVLYWSKENFGSAAPFITVTHVTIVCRSALTCIVASRDVYSSRYLDASLALTIATDAAPAADSLYLVYANRSRADALKGAFSGLRRTIVERRARGTLEDSLKGVKNRLEKPR